MTGILRLLLTVAILAGGGLLHPLPAVAAPAIDSNHLVAADGARLPLRRWLPPAEPPKAVLLALHGFNDYSNFFAGAGAWLAERGIASYAYDQRGFGGAPNRGRWPGTAALLDDLRLGARALRRRHPGVPLYLLGESMGGAVIMTAMASGEAPPADGIILAAPAVWGRASMPWYQTVALWVARQAIPGSRVSGRGLGIQASDNIDMLRALGRDPMMITQTRVDAVFGLVNLMDAAMASAPRVDAAALILYGEKDQLIPDGAVREMLARLPPAPDRPRTVAVYADGWHMLLRDRQAETVWYDILHWIADPRMVLPSGADMRAVRLGTCPPSTPCAGNAAGRHADAPG